MRSMVVLVLAAAAAWSASALSDTCGAWGDQPCSSGQDRHPDPLPEEPFAPQIRFPIPAGLFAPVQKNEQILGFSAVSLPPNECGKSLCENATDPACHSHGADFDKPIFQVLKEHHGLLGSCHFHHLADVAYLGRAPDYPLEALFAWTRREKTPGAEPREVTYNWERAPVVAKLEDESQALGDLLSFAMRWLQGQDGVDTSLMADSAAWEALAAKQCSAVQSKYGFDSAKVSMMDIIEHLRTMDMRARCSTGAEASAGTECGLVTEKDLARIYHNYCVLGVQSAAQTIAKYHARACLLSGNRIGHMADCL